MRLFELLKKQRYKVFNHSAVKLCLWTKKSIRDLGFCYKQKFYGIESHRCMQCTPAVGWCTMRCRFCWRPITETCEGLKIPEENDPEEIVENLIKLHRTLLTGLGGVPHNEKKLREARDPRHAAISLAGEPMVYSKMDGLLKEFHKRGMTTFLVTNGTFPERVVNLKELPTQLYVSVCAPNRRIFKSVNSPVIPDAWERLNRTLEILNDIGTTTVIRLTLAKGLNFTEPNGYGKLIKKASPDFVEVKAAMPVGFAKDRLEYSQMPLHREIKEFSEKISSVTGYILKDEKEDSRVVLLSRE
ncbi:MAG: 4-demethylwyosine synthase TYW1 [Candidatus Micrarchaeota archaeon]|nr:4-demethylwyosine synthase TYW1 [Candidatus Micrarchaeota archaeon]